jgi:excisionase family DNA binding protein
MSTRYLSIKEVAGVLSISEKTVYKMVKSNLIPGHFKLGSMHFIDEEVFRARLKALATDKAKKTFSIIHQTCVDKHGLMK